MESEKADDCEASLAAAEDEISKNEVLKNAVHTCEVVDDVLPDTQLDSFYAVVKSPAGRIVATGFADARRNITEYKSLVAALSLVSADTRTNAFLKRFTEIEAVFNIMTVCQALKRELRDHETIPSIARCCVAQFGHSLPMSLTKALNARIK